MKFQIIIYNFIPNFYYIDYEMLAILILANAQIKRSALKEKINLRICDVLHLLVRVLYY